MISLELIGIRITREEILNPHYKSIRKCLDLASKYHIYCYVAWVNFTNRCDFILSNFEVVGYYTDMQSV